MENKCLAKRLPVVWGRRAKAENNLSIDKRKSDATGDGSPRKESGLSDLLENVITTIERFNEVYALENSKTKSTRLAAAGDRFIRR